MTMNFLFNQSAVLGAVAVVFFIIYIAHCLRSHERRQRTDTFADQCAAKTAAWQAKEQIRAETYWNCTLKELIHENAMAGATSMSVYSERGAFYDKLVAILKQHGFDVQSKYPVAGLGRDNMVTCVIHWGSSSSEDVPSLPPARQH